MGDLSHEIDVGERRELLFEFDFSCTGRAKVDKVVNVETEVDRGFRASGAEHAGVIRCWKEATLC